MKKRSCVVCGGERRGLSYQSWEPTGPFSRRRLDVRERWQCLDCGTRSTEVAGSESARP